MVRLPASHRSHSVWLTPKKAECRVSAPKRSFAANRFRRWRGGSEGLLNQAGQPRHNRNRARGGSSGSDEPHRSETDCGSNGADNPRSAHGWFASPSRGVASLLWRTNHGGALLRVRSVADRLPESGCCLGTQPLLSLANSRRHASRRVVVCGIATLALGLCKSRHQARQVIAALPHGRIRLRLACSGRQLQSACVHGIRPGLGWRSLCMGRACQAGEDNGDRRHCACSDGTFHGNLLRRTAAVDLDGQELERDGSKSSSVVRQADLHVERHASQLQRKQSGQRLQKAAGRAGRSASEGATFELVARAERRHLALPKSLLAADGDHRRIVDAAGGGACQLMPSGGRRSTLKSATSRG